MCQVSLLEPFLFNRVRERKAIAPGRLRDADRRDQRRAFGGAERVDAAVERQQAGEKAVQPGALLRGKWRSIGNQGRQRRRRGVGHSLACVSNKAFSASMSYRRVKAAKL